MIGRIIMLMTPFGLYLGKVVDVGENRIKIENPVQLVVDMRTGLVGMVEVEINDLTVVGSFGFTEPPQDLVAKYLASRAGLKIASNLDLLKV
jgi:hypothetical protein